MESPQVSADHLHGNGDTALLVQVKEEESEVRLCVEESSAMTPSDELHSTDSASFPSLTDDDITDDVTTNDITTDDISTVGGLTPEPMPRNQEGKESKTDFIGSAAAAPPSSSIAVPPSSTDMPTCAEAPPTSTAPPPPLVTPPTALVAPPASSSAPSSAMEEVGPVEAGPQRAEPQRAEPQGAEPQGAGPQGVGPQEVYLVKWITWKEERTPIITQSQNGPCPLLAIMNTLFLRWKAKLPAQTEVVTTEDLMTHLGECVLSATPREKSKGVELNFQQNMSDAMAVLPKLCTGLDVNVRFTGVCDFEYTPECIVFDLLNIPLYHGWLLDPQSPETVAAVGKLSYNQLVEKIIDCKHSADSCKVSEGLVAEQFLESTASQLSYHGLCELTSRVREGEISVFFRNNHFSTMTKHQSHLYLLVTDQGFQSEERLVWESLHNVEGDGNFCDSDFRLFQKSQDYNRTTVAQVDQDYNRSTAAQIDQDYLVAVSLQQSGGDPVTLSDAELARQLQQEEYQQQQSTTTATTTTTPQQQHQVRGPGAQSRRREKDSDCVLL
ncbi:ubiquitin carboxyl-terminal hydrolase MINDY-1 [Periophthalmus magnuspinnatus]|uniref:ubiquitin carboxyl-terminal hydrolase MINDY-1 n=1 Tax=Periophthalmus magnuspinnatus TaxID=409849 RepID=UPI002436F764|nr:ubiquitin carboxyl-terminal hydrolase MINDY-1 [Periophthalmus magnuspinnatus]